MKTCFFIILALSTLTIHLGRDNALARGFDDEDFSLRFPAAITRFSTYGDVAASGGASAGSQWSSSMNPAAIAWREIEEHVHLTSSPQYSALLFHEGTVLHVSSISVQRKLGNYGVIQPAFARIWTNREAMRDGTVFELDMTYGQVQWAKRFSPRWSLGMSLNMSSSDLDNDIGRFITADSSSDTYGFRAGALYKAVDRLLLGLVAEVSSSSSDTDIYIFRRRLVDLDDVTHQVVVRPGLSYEYKEKSSIFLDYQYARFSNDAGRLSVHRFYAGIDPGYINGSMLVQVLRLIRREIFRGPRDLDFTRAKCLAWTLGTSMICSQS